MRKILTLISLTALMPLSSWAAGKPSIDILPSSYLPPANLPIQESIDHILNGLDAMKTYGEVHRTLKAFRPDSDHKDLAMAFRGLENEVLPKVRKNGLTLVIEVLGQGNLELEIVNIQKSRFRIQGSAYTFQFTKPFAQTLADLKDLIFKTKNVFFPFQISVLSSANAQGKNTALDGTGQLIAGAAKVFTGQVLNQAGCSQSPPCETERQKRERLAKEAEAAGAAANASISESQRFGIALVDASVKRAEDCKPMQTQPAEQTQSARKKTASKVAAKSPVNNSSRECKGAILDYIFYCNKVKAAYPKPTVDQIRIDDRTVPNWSTIDCTTTSHVFQLGSSWKTPQRTQEKSGNNGGGL